ncbi:UNVERIFIED_CONTAM: hypothetical protein GTU68_001243, partial [Idotea baltica]|nr:hypothetical protein [Idotea baltica]
APIGVFDSGIGGLSVLKEIKQCLPSESLLFIADSAYVPYGDKSPSFIKARCRFMAKYLIDRGAKALVLACNTATAFSADELRKLYPSVPIIGMEPGIRPAKRATRSGTIGVLATMGTLNSARFYSLVDRFATDITVITQPCPGLVEIIETGALFSPILRNKLETLVFPLLDRGCDTLILGCTHYPFLKPLLAQMIPDDIVIVDTGSAVANQLKQQLLKYKLESFQKNPKTYLGSTSNNIQFRKMVSMLWSKESSAYSLFVVDEYSPR